MKQHAWGAAVLLVLLAGCGGGADDSPAARAAITRSTSARVASRTSVPTPPGRAYRARSTPCTRRSRASAASGAASGRAALPSTPARRAAAVSPAQAAEQLLDFAESHYPAYFPSHQATSTFDPFLYRSYPQTGIYVGVVVKPGMGYTMDGVYVLGGVFGDVKPVYVGQLSAFITPVDPGPTSRNNGCYDLALLETAGTRLELTLQQSGETTGTLTQVSTTGGTTTFAGHSAIETVIKLTGTQTVGGMTSPVDVDTRSYQKRTGDTEVTSYGEESVSHTTLQGASVTIATTEVYTPPSVDRIYGLAAGESLTQANTVKTTKTTTGIPGTSGTPSTTYETTTETLRFAGREQVTVPAGTFNACRIDTTSADAPNVVVSQWVIDGKGIPVKVQTKVDGVVIGTQQATVVKLNGQSL